MGVQQQSVIIANASSVLNLSIQNKFWAISWQKKQTKERRTKKKKKEKKKGGRNKPQNNNNNNNKTSQKAVGMLMNPTNNCR